MNFNRQLSFPESFAYFENEVIIWGRDRKIIQNSNSRAQASKAMEEVDELLDHTSMIRILRRIQSLAKPHGHLDLTCEEEIQDLKAMIADDIGDILVCLIMVAEIEGLNLKDCLAQAYSEIKDRKGEMRADGKFYKESP